MKEGDQVVCYIEGTVTKVEDWGITVLTTTGDTWTFEHGDADWKVKKDE